MGKGTKLALQAPSRGPSQPHPGLHRASSGAVLSSSSSSMVLKGPCPGHCKRKAAGQVTAGSSSTSCPGVCPAMGEVSSSLKATGCGHRASPPLPSPLCMRSNVDHTWPPPASCHPRGAPALAWRVQTLTLASSRLLLSFSTQRGSAGDALERQTD